MGNVTFEWPREAARKKRELFILHYAFPGAVRGKIRDRYPHLRDDDVAKVLTGLREYFAICDAADGRFVSMPSRVVDMAWHEFLLYTRAYQEFCTQALGRYLHHTPAEALPTPTLAEEGLKRAWRLSCQREGIDPKNATRLPLLFAIDFDLGIPDGIEYPVNYAKQQGCGGGGCGGCSGGCGGCGGCGG